MHVFLTGAAGFVGRHLCHHLLEAGHEVTALLLPNEDPAPIAGARVVRGDLTRPETLRGHLHDHDAVVHLAGAVGYGQRADVCQAVNVDGTAHLADAATAAGVRRFVHMSSVSVYGRVPGVPLREDSPRRRIGDPYGDSKIEAEQLLEARADRGQLDLTMLRPTVVYGPGDDKFLPKLVENLRSGRARVIGDGNNTVDLVHVDDLCRFIGTVLEDPRTIGAIYNVNDPRNGTWRDLLRVVASELDCPAPSSHLPYPIALAAAAVMEVVGRVAGRPPRLTRYAVRVIGRQYCYPVDRAQSAGFRPTVGLEQGIRACLSSPAAGHSAA